MYFLALSTRGRRSSDAVVTMSPAITQNSVLSTMLQKREPGLFGEMAGPRAEGGKVKDKPGISVVPEIT